MEREAFRNVNVMDADNPSKHAGSMGVTASIAVAGASMGARRLVSMIVVSCVPILLSFNPDDTA
jgi:hypothetical protein